MSFEFHVIGFFREVRYAFPLRHGESFMSPTKKVLISIGGAILGHAVLFGLIGVLLLVSAIIGPPKLAASTLVETTAPKEITISFSELIEKMKVLPPEPELPESEERPEEKADEPKPAEAQKLAKNDPSYIRTFTDQESSAAPKDPKFESDRNTEAGTKVAPDLNDPDALKGLPSLDGSEEAPGLAMRDRKFIDGDFIDRESGGANSAAAMGNPAQSQSAPPKEMSPDPFKEQDKPSDQQAKLNQQTDAKQTDPDSPPETKKTDARAGQLNEGEKRPELKDSGQPDGLASEELKSPAEMAAKPVKGPENAVLEKPADAEEIPMIAGETAAQPKATEFGAAPQMDQAEESFVVANSMKAPVISDNVATTDQKAIAERREENVGPAASPETPRPMASALPSAATAPLPPPSATALAQSPAAPAIPQNVPQPNSVPSPAINPTAVQNETPAFMPEMIQTRVKGTLSNEKANAAVAAEKTPLGIYKRAVTDAIGRTWHRYRVDNADFVEWGTMKISFRVDRNGKVKDLKLVENKANTVMAEFSLKAILDADIPKMPDGIADILGSRGLAMDYDIFVH